MRAPLLLLLLAPAALAAPPGSKISVVEAGAEPRQPLRYAPKKGPAEPITVTTGLRTVQDTAGRRSEAVLPDTRFTFSPATLAVSGDGFEATLALTAVEALPRKGAEPAARAAFQKAWRQLKGLRVLMAVTARGKPTKAQLKMRAKPPELLREALQSLMQTVRDLQVRLPAEPVGVGARWTVREPVETAEGPVTRITTWTLEGREGSRLRLKYEQTQAGQAGQPLSGLPDGMTARIQGLTGTASGTVLADLERPVPPKVREQGTLTLVVAGATGGKAFEMTTTLHTRTRIDAASR